MHIHVIGGFMPCRKKGKIAATSSLRRSLCQRSARLLMHCLLTALILVPTAGAQHAARESRNRLRAPITRGKAAERTPSSQQGSQQQEADKAKKTPPSRDAQVWPSPQPVHYLPAASQ